MSANNSTKLASPTFLFAVAVVVVVVVFVVVVLLEDRQCRLLDWEMRRCSRLCPLASSGSSSPTLAV